MNEESDVTDSRDRSDVRGRDRRRDEGAILPIVLVVSVVLSAVVVAIATYTTATLRYGHVVEARADRLAAAEAAMGDALERLRIVDGLCTTAGGDGEVVNPSFPDINGVPVEVRCSQVGGTFPPYDGWAIVVTGEDQPAGDTFITSAGGTPILEGPVYVHDVNRIDFRDTTIKNGSLWYTDPDCSGPPEGGDKLAFKSSDITIPNLTFDPPTRKIYCINLGWEDLFEVVPVEGHLSGLGLPTNPAPRMEGTCRVFSPGRYTTAPALASDNYFENGTYVFQNLGNLSLSHTRVTFGTTRPEEDKDYPLLPLSSACEQVRQDEITALELDDTLDSGATLYLAGDSRFTINVQSHIEISGRQQGAFIVAMHALGGGTPWPASNVAQVLGTGSGNFKESAFSGLVWAPRAKIEVGTVAAAKEAAFRGGIVIGAFEGTISAAPSGGFLIRVPTSQASVKLLLEATASNDRGDTTIRVVADYRPSRGDVAVNSWRVCPASGC